MWYDEAVIYQIYPLGLCGAPLQNDGDPSQADQHRLLRVLLCLILLCVLLCL